MALHWLSITLNVSLFSRAPSVSPTHKMGFIPDLSAAKNLFATSKLFSLYKVRLSECPTKTYSQAKSCSIVLDVSPVKAPE